MTFATFKRFQHSGSGTDLGLFFSLELSALKGTTTEEGQGWALWGDAHGLPGPLEDGQGLSWFAFS